MLRQSKLALVVLGVPWLPPSQVLAQESRRPVTVQDSVRMTRLADILYFNGEFSTGRVATFSPDGTQFAVVLRAANVELRYFRRWAKDSVCHGRGPTELLGMRSVRSRRDTSRRSNVA